MTAFVCEPLGKHHDRESFQCGIPDLDSYLQRQASQDMRRRVAAAFVMVPIDDPSRIAGFYSLSSSTVELKRLPNSVRKHVPRYPVVPAILIGRLARDINFPGIGGELLIDALKRSETHSKTVAAAVVVVDAKNDTAARFYEQHGFVQLPGIGTRMFLSMKTIHQLFK